MALNPFKRKAAAEAPPVIPAPAPAPSTSAPVPSEPPAPQPPAAQPQPPAPAAPPAADPSAAPSEAGRKSRAKAKGKRGAASELRRHREDLAARLAEGQYNLGGLIYEMGIRRDYRMEVVQSRVDALQRLDAELAETDRVLVLDDAAASGSCSNCGALYARNSSFCWQCGTPLAAEAKPGEPVPPDAPPAAPSVKPMAPPVAPPSGNQPPAGPPAPPR